MYRLRSILSTALHRASYTKGILIGLNGIVDDSPWGCRQAVEGLKEPDPDSDAVSCQRELAVVTVAQQDGASPSSNNTTIIPSTLAANMSRCLALKRKEPVRFLTPVYLCS